MDRKRAHEVLVDPVLRPICTMNLLRELSGTGETPVAHTTRPLSVDGTIVAVRYSVPNTRPRQATLYSA